MMRKIVRRSVQKVRKNPHAGFRGKAEALIFELECGHRVAARRREGKQFPQVYCETCAVEAARKGQQSAT